MSTPCSTTILPYPAFRLFTSSNGSAAEICTNDLLVHTDFGRRPRGEHAPKVQYRDMVADVEDQVGMMLNQHHTNAAPDDLLYELSEPLDFVRCQTRRWLVEQKEGRLGHERAGDFDEAQLAVLQTIRADIGEALQSDGTQRLQRHFAQHRLVAAVTRQQQQRLREGRAPPDRATNHDVL